MKSTADRRGCGRSGAGIRMSLIFIVRTNCSAGKSRLNHMSTRGSPSNEKEISHGRGSWQSLAFLKAHSIANVANIRQRMPTAKAVKGLDVIPGAFGDKSAYRGTCVGTPGGGPQARRDPIHSSRRSGERQGTSRLCLGRAHVCPCLRLSEPGVPKELWRHRVCSHGVLP